MKNLFLALLISFGLLGITACKDSKTTRADEKNVITSADVPAPVQSAFTNKYTAASEIIWEDANENGETSYKVKFKRDGKYWKAEFKADGSLIKEKEDD